MVLRGLELALHCLAAMAWRPYTVTVRAIAPGPGRRFFEFLSYGSGCEGLGRCPGSLASQIRTRFLPAGFDS